MSNRKYQRLSEGYHERSPFHPYQASSKHPGKNCIADGGRDGERSPTSSGFGSRGCSTYSSTNRHTNSPPRSHRFKYANSRSKDGEKRGSSQSPSDSTSHTGSNSRAECQSRFNHISNNEEFPWSQHGSSSGKTYYYNFKTEKSQWEKPKEWIERERREKEKMRQKQLTALESKESGSGKEQTVSRDSNFGKSNKYISFKTVASDRWEGNQPHISRGFAEERGRDNHQPSSTDRGYSVVKTLSAYTSAMSTAAQRSTPVATNMFGNSAVSPAGSLQDVSPPSTPSSRASMFESLSHSASPQLISVSPRVTQYPASQSPHLQQHQPFPPRVPAQNMYPQVTQSVCTAQFALQQYSMQQQQSSYAQYGLVNNGNPLHTPPTTSQPQKMLYDVPAQPALHPLQQATLLHQRQLSENKHRKQFSVLSQPSITQLQTTASTLVKQDNIVHNSPGSPVIFSHIVTTATKEQFSSLPPLHTSCVSALSPCVQSSPSTVSPVSSQPSPTVNLQALAKYSDKNLTTHVCGWVTEVAEKQVQRLSDEGSCSASDADRVMIEQLQLQSQINLLELRLDVGTKRVSSLKGVTKTLELLLAESDKKSLT